MPVNKVTLVTFFGIGQGITDFDVEYFDGSRWLTALSDATIEWKLNDSTKERQSVAFPTVNAYKLRLKVNDGNRVWGNIALNELIVEHIPEHIPVTGISLDQPQLVLNQSSDRRVELKATVTPENATNPKIAWSTSDARVATVDDQGTVTAAGEGTAVITAQTDDGHFEASSRITVDWTAPEITIRSVTTSVYNTGMLQPQLDISDRLTGVDEAKTEVLLDGNKLGTLDGVPLYLLEPGDHVLTVQAEDLAGNGAEKSVRFQVLTSYETLGELVRHFANRGWIDNQGIANSLLKKLQKRNAGSFIQEVEAQKGKHISAEAAEFLLRDAGRLLNP